MNGAKRENSSYDLGNLCHMFKAVLRSILIAAQDGNIDRVIACCECATKQIDRLERHHESEHSCLDS